MQDDVDHYGIHWDGPTAWLLQGGKGSNFVGLKGLSPFRVRGGACNHKVSTAAPIPDYIHWDQFMKVFKDPLVQAMLPIPHAVGENIIFLADPYEDLSLYLHTLSRLSSPIKNVVKPIWTTKMRDLEKELNTTNIQPLVLVQTNQKSQALVDAIGKLALYVPRTVVIVGTEDVVVRAPIRRITTEIRKFPLEDLCTLPLENLGATMIRRLARREELDAPWETRDQRRARQIQERSGQ